MQIPDQIVHVDSYIKQLLMSCYKEDQRLFPKFLKSCTSQQAKKDCLKYWNSIPVRLIKKGDNSVSIVPKNNNFDQTAEKRVRKRFNPSESDIRVRKIKLPLSECGEKQLSRFFRKKSLSKENELRAIKLFFMYDSHDISAYIARLRSERKQKAQETLHESNTIQSQKTDINISIANTSSPKSTRLSKAEKKRLNKARWDKLLAESRDIKASLKSDKIVCETIPWSAIIFQNGSVWIYNSRMDGRVLLKSKGHLTIPCKESRECFNVIKNLFVQRLPNVKAEVRNNYIVKLVSDIEIRNAIRVLQEIDEYEDWNGDSSPILIPSSFNAIRLIDNDKVLRELKKKKSKFLNFLVSKQEPHRKVVPCKELLSYEKSRSEEDAFIFSIKSHYSQRELLVLENVNVARATVAFIISKSHYESALRVAFDFIRSNELNKRQRLHYKRFDFSKSGIIDYVCINHSFLHEWMYRFNEL